MLDVDLARLYGVTTKALNQAMRRNASRFPEDFAFRISRKEFDSMRSQIVTTSRTRPTMWSQIVTRSQKYRRADSLPVAFTEHGVAMLSSVLHSDRAADVNLAVIRTFVKLREVLATHKDLARKVEQHEHGYDKFERHQVREQRHRDDR